MKLMVADGQRQMKEAAARGEEIAVWGPSPGFRELRWIRPVLAGDTISFTSVIESKRTSEKRPEWGILQARNGGTNQRGEPVYSTAGDRLRAATEHRRLSQHGYRIAPLIELVLMNPGNGFFANAL